MIYIDRSRTDEGGQPIRPPGKWSVKANKATQAVIRDPGNHEFENGIYADDLVRATLEKLFYNKCAYCEQRLPESAWNVEHFRPKGSVAESRNHPGYYWLAYEWENLYPACVPCNQRRRDKPIWGDLREGITGGKADQFPLKNEGTRVYEPGKNIKREKKLLIDPCQEDPEAHLTFGINGEIVGLDEYGKATIGICSLARRRLMELRAQKIKGAVTMLELIRDSQSRGDRTLVRRLQTLMDEFLLSHGCEFAGVVRAIVGNPEAFGL